MAFTSFTYLIFFIVTCLVYFSIKDKLKTGWLLLCSYYFYMSWNPLYSLLMLFSTFITWISGILISKSNTSTKKKIWVFLSLLINLSILGLYKYYPFMSANLNIILSHISLHIPDSLNLLLPVGISFYTFQALSYTIDIYRKDVEVEKNFFRYALFVSFFPQLVAGPIEKSKDLLKQFQKTPELKWSYIKSGLVLIMIGVFFKLVISDRAALIVNTVYNNLNTYAPQGGVYLLLATFFFAVQIYFDFYAYSIIAKGSARVLGYHLSQNFNTPYLATSIKDFWRRWHVSLSSWFKEYLYFPLGGSRKGFVRTQINLMIVFMVSGLWHGAAWTFVIWGFLHGSYQIIENIIRKIRNNKEESKNLFVKIIKILITFILVDFAWIFFRANRAGDAILVIKHLFDFGKAFKISELGISDANFWILIITTTLTFITEIVSQKINLAEWLDKRNIAIRWTFFYIILFSIIILGIYGPGYSAQEFIYFQF